MILRPPLGLYYHIPFCRQKCDYCHFYVIPDQERYQLLLMEGLEMEWDRVKSTVAQHRVRSLYIGGGTPARLSPERIAQIIEQARPYFDGCEVTLEANPDDVSLDQMRAYREAGVNRVSLGVQSFDDALLPKLGRLHDAATAVESVHCIRAAGIENLSIDLIYDLPDQSLASWEASLREACRLPVTHISLYNLQIEPNTVFYKKREEITARMPNETLSAEMLDLACKLLPEAGFPRYELSAFGIPSRHNSGYWTGRPFLGLGPSAFSYYNGKRFRNVAHLHKYHRALSGAESACDFDEELDSDAQERELLVVGLRLLKGVDLDTFKLDETCLKSIASLIESGLLEQINKRLRLTSRGRQVHDSVAAELI